MSITLTVVGNYRNLVENEFSPTLVSGMPIIADTSRSSIVGCTSLNDVAEFSEHLLRTSIEPAPLLLMARSTY